jgi:hypothetical protein
MTWFEHHRESSKLAAAARKLLRRGDEHKAQKLYEKAAREAERAMALVPRERKVTFGVIAMLAHRLWRHAHRSEDAARVAEVIRASPEQPCTTQTDQASRYAYSVCRLMP